MWGLEDCVPSKVLSAPTTKSEQLAVIHRIILFE